MEKGLSHLQRFIVSYCLNFAENNDPMACKQHIIQNLYYDQHTPATQVSVSRAVKSLIEKGLIKQAGKSAKIKEFTITEAYYDFILERRKEVGGWTRKKAIKRTIEFLNNC